MVKISKELNINEVEFNLVNNVIPKPKECGESSRRETQLMGPRYTST